jgi:UDP-N-acetyl-D-glucosamine dehydrogenase
MSIIEDQVGSTVTESTELVESTLSRIEARTAVIGVVGLGYVGLPLCVTMANAGFRVVGLELNVDKVAAVNAGLSYIGDVPSETLAPLVRFEGITATSDPSALGDVDVVIITVPTPLTRNLAPDLSYVESAASSIAATLRRGQLVVLESPTYPGTCSEVLEPILSRSGLALESEYFLAYSPERVDPGNHQFGTKNTNKVVGGAGPNSLAIATALYSCAIDAVVPVSSTDAAEMVKVFENIFRAVNIGLVNELALLCDRMKLNVWEVLDAAFTKPFGIMPFYPGPGIGGHCIPLDPHYLEWKAREYNFPTRFVQLAGEINRRMPEFVVDKTTRELNRAGKSINASTVLIIGVAYKADIDDWRESPALELIELFERAGATVMFHDPHVAEISVRNRPMYSEELTPELLARCTVGVVATAHAALDVDAIVAGLPLIVDTRNMMAKRGVMADHVIVL